MIASGDVVVYGMNKANRGSDAFLALPADALGNEYFVASYSNEGSVSQIGIVATQNDTAVVVTVPYMNRGIVLRYGSKAFKEGEHLNISLGMYETVQLESYQDLTGVHINATKPIAVFSGDTSLVATKDGFLSQDHFSEQLSPTQSWGRSFATVPFSTSESDDVFKIIGKHSLG